ncbi:MAG TPA: EAL domain-containing protein, partial [Chloroflexota bacterium]
IDERRRHLDQGGRFLSEYRMSARDGHTVWVRDEAVIVHDGPRGAATLHGVVSDITERKLTAQILEHQVLHDALTSLPNRTLLFDRLQQAIRGSHRTGSPVALLLMDLDRFKEVNDTFGHHCGDMLLQQVSGRFRSTLRDSDTIARLGGDEFAVLLVGADAMGAALAADKLSLALKEAFEIDDHSLDIGISIGAALYPDCGDDATVLLQRAEVAMYSAKRAESRFAFYESEQDPYSPTRLALIRDLRQAIERDDLTLHYQPKAHFETGCAAHVEALARWHHQDHGFVPPDRFIPLAEHAGLINALSMWVLNAALRQCRQWHEDGLDVSVAVNLSPRSLHDPNLVQAISDALRRWGASPGWLQLEITEGALMVDPARAMDTLSRLHSMGICIAIDDFGTGYSSLGYLKRLPADQIKIDKSFVQDMASNEDDAFIVRSVIDLGHSLGLEVVAEGVEDQATWDMLAAMGCDLGQGYHLSRPLPSAQLGQWLKQPSSILGPTVKPALNSVRAAGA